MAPAVKAVVKADTTPAAKNPMKAKPPAKTPMRASKKTKSKPMKATKPEKSEHKDRGKARYCKLHKHELPEDIQKLMDDSGSHEAGRLINKLVVKDADGRWAFNTDDAFVKESMSDLIAR